MRSSTIWGEVESSTANPVMRSVVVGQPMSTGHTAYHNVGHDDLGATTMSCRPGFRPRWHARGTGKAYEWYQRCEPAGRSSRGSSVSVTPTHGVFDNASMTLGVAAMGLAAYHGYKRYNSAGWAVAYGILAGISPWITLGVSVAQGFGKRRGH